ncbi:unnamed protein product, partial [Meganyctiphanes norvegica]
NKQSGTMAKWTGKKANVSYIKPEEPKFLKAFKEKVGYKEDKEILQAKFADMPSATNEDLEDGEDEQPQVVLLKTGDISQEEYDKLRSEGRLSELLNDRSKENENKDVQGCANKKDNAKIPEDGRIIFQPSTKRSHTKNDECEVSEKKTKKEKKIKKNKPLLSFNEDEEEEF